MLYKIKWEGYEERTWEPEENVQGATKALEAWKEAKKAKREARKEKAARRVAAEEEAEGEAEKAAASAEAEGEVEAQGEEEADGEKGGAGKAAADDDDDDIFVRDEPAVAAKGTASAAATCDTKEEGEDEEDEEDEEEEDAMYEVSSIRAKRVVVGDDGAECEEYLVRWVGYTCEDDTWEPRENVEELDVFAEFKERRAKEMMMEAQAKAKGGSSKSTKASSKSFLR